MFSPSRAKIGESGFSSMMSQYGPVVQAVKVVVEGKQVDKRVNKKVAV